MPAGRARGRRVRGGPLVADQGTAIALGLAAFRVGWLLLWDAWEGRGRPTPPVMRPFTWW